MARLHPTVRAMLALFRTSDTSATGDEVAMWAQTGAPSGSTTPTGQVMDSTQSAVVFRQDHGGDPAAALYITSDGGTKWKAPFASAPTLISQQVAFADLTAAATTESIAFSSKIPAKAVVLGSWFDVGDLFSGGGASSAVIDVGDGVDPDGYVDGENIFTGAATGQRSKLAAPAALLSGTVDVADAERTPTVAITSDVNVDTLTAGDVTAYILYSAVPLGPPVS